MFLLKLEMRLKLTFFLFIQQLADDERMTRITEEARDWSSLVVQVEKNRKYNQPDPAATGSLDNVRDKIVRNNQKAMEDARKKYDQNGQLVSVVDQVLFNEFTLLQLC